MGLHREAEGSSAFAPRRWPWLALLSLAAATSQAQTPLFVQDVSERDRVRGAISPVVRGEYRVVPNIFGLAQAFTVDRPTTVRLVLPGEGRPTELPVRLFEPRQGFELDERGALRLRRGAKPDDIAFLLHAAGNGAELSLNVEGGRMFGGLNGTFARRHQGWEIRSGDGGTLLRDIDTAQIPRHPEDRPSKAALSRMPIDAMRGDKGLGTSTLPIDEWLEIDILIVHTAQAMALAGPTGMAELLQGSLDDMQIALNQSQLGHVQVRNVMPNGQVSAPVGYVEPPVGDDHEQRFLAHRRWARTSNAVALLRNSHQADIVVLAVADDGYCGIAYTQRPGCDSDDTGLPQCRVGAGYVNFAFAVISVGARCPRIAHEFAHEVGHTFGLEHDPDRFGTLPDAASFGWSYGYQVSTVAAKARTIMAYERLEDCPDNCPITLHYSNPHMNFQSLLPLQVPTGNDAEDREFLTRQFNARTIALNAPVMVGFRGPGVAPPPAQRILRGRFEPFPDRECLVIPHENCPP